MKLTLGERKILTSRGQLQGPGVAAVIDWRGEPGEIVDTFAEFLPHEHLTWREEEGAIVVGASGRWARVPTVTDPPWGLDLAAAIAAIISPAFEARPLRGSLDDDTHRYLVRPAAWWTQFRADHAAHFRACFDDPRRLPKRFELLEGEPPTRRKRARKRQTPRNRARSAKRPSAAERWHATFWREGPARLLKIVSKLEDPNQIVDETFQETFLTIAAHRQGLSEVVVALLGRGARPNVATTEGKTPLMLAATRGDVASVKALLDAGATTKEKDCIGRTALMWAAWARAPEACDLLLAAGADPTLADDNGKTAADLAGRTLLAKRLRATRVAGGRSKRRQRS